MPLLTPSQRPSYASVIRHRTDEERSSVYERLVELEEAAKAAKRGIHSNKVRQRGAAELLCGRIADMQPAA